MFEKYVQTGLYLKGWSPKTAAIYERAFNSYRQIHPTGEVSKPNLNEWVVSLGRLTPSGRNIFIRCLNSYCHWLHDEGHVGERLKVKQFKAHPKPVTILDPVDIKLLMSTKKRGRAWVLCVVLVDSGLRIDEALGLRREDVDFDNLLLVVLGKGRKPRRIPFSIEARRHLWRYMQKVERPFVFGTRTGTRMSYRNARRGVGQVFREAGITKHVHPHLLRHSFASNYIKAGGNIYTLSRLLGHASVTTTERYLRGLQTTDLQHLSPLS